MNDILKGRIQKDIKIYKHVSIFVFIHQLRIQMQMQVVDKWKPRVHFKGALRASASISISK